MHHVFLQVFMNFSSLKDQMQVQSAIAAKFDTDSTKNTGAGSTHARINASESKASSPIETIGQQQM